MKVQMTIGIKRKHLEELNKLAQFLHRTRASVIDAAFEKYIKEKKGL